MSEYMERHTVSRLIGAPPGYVGYDRGGLLTEAVSKTPHAVLLLDEIEKAHPDVFNVLLQVMDHGTLTDNNGKKADFRHVVLIMTSNVGAQELARGMLGFGNRDEQGNEDHAQLAEREVTVSLTEAARNYLAEKGYDKHFGARPLARLIQDELKRPLGDELLFGQLENGGHVTVDCREGALKFEMMGRPPKAGPSGPKLLN
jgi:ATP-dependent Clp protease ATP-binding subunit ClpA